MSVFLFDGPSNYNSWESWPIPLSPFIITNFSLPQFAPTVPLTSCIDPVFPNSPPDILYLACSPQIPLRRQCVDQYKEFGRYNVFSHEELLLRMVSKTDSLLLDIAETLFQDLQVILHSCL